MTWIHSISEDNFFFFFQVSVIFHVCSIQVLDLCTADTCKLMSVEKMVLYSYSKRWVL